MPNTEPCRTCRGTGLIETAAQDSRVLAYEVCPDCDVIHDERPPSAPASTRDALCAALVQEDAALLTLPLRDRNRVPDAAQEWYVRGGRDALWRVAARLDLTDLHDQAAQVVAREQRNVGP